MSPPSHLTPEQMVAVDANAPRLLLVASAGSGKTEVLTRRVVRHLSESSGQTYRILAATFTVRAAQELQERVSAGASAEAWRVDADTIHGFALDWLMRFGQAVGIYPDTVVYSDNLDRIALLETFVVSLGESKDEDLAGVIRAIDACRSDWSPGVDAPLDGPAVGSIPFEDLYDGYLTALDAAGGIDFPGMLTKFLEAAEDDPSFIGNFRSTYRHVLVDEGQDLSGAQAAVIDSLIAPPVDLFVVADDRQSINGFAGGKFDHAMKLVGEQAYRNRLHLPHNFRCSKAVLNAAERLAQHLESTPSESLAAANSPPGSVRLVAAASPVDEAEIIGRWVSSLLDEGLDPAGLSLGEDPTVQPEDIAVIARARWLLDPVLEILDSKAIRVSLQTDSQSFLETPIGRVLSECIGLRAAPDSAPGLRRLAEELHGIGIDLRPDTDIFEQLRGAADPDLRLIERAVDGLTVQNLAERLRLLIEGGGNEQWVVDVLSLETIWVNYTVVVPHHRRDLPGFIRFLFRSQQTRPSDPGVRLLTIHKVKGLEFKAVCLLGAYGGVLPDYRANRAPLVEEERRAFYVAMTRASRSLLITYPTTTVDRYGRPHRQSASIFAHEAGLV